MLHDGVHAQIKADSYEIPPIFDMLAKDADKTVELVNASGQKGFIIGEITEGEKGITLV